MSGTPRPGGDEFRSGLVTILGRPNVGKSTLVNRIVGTKVAITSSRPQTTRRRIHGVRTTPGHQLVLVDTPGLHRPRTLLGERCNDAALRALDGVDVACLVLDANGAVGPGDRFVADALLRSRTAHVVVVNKVDRASRGRIAERLREAAALLPDAAAFVPLSARTGEGVDALVHELEALLPPGPHYYPEDVASDQSEEHLAAELVREQLLRVARDELPHSITVVPEEWDDTGSVLRIRVVVYVERESQKGMVIGAGGAVLRDAGTAARRQLEERYGRKVHLETVVRVERDWQRREAALERLGL